MNSKIFGWISFIFWGLLPYPQILTNIKKKNSDGMSINMIFYSLLQYSCYMFITFVLFFSKTIKNKYQTILKENSTDIIVPDLFFAINSLLTTIILAVQYFYYEHTNNIITRLSKIFFLTFITLLFMLLIYFPTLYFIHDDYIYLGYLIVIISIFNNIFTFLKYVPQLYYTFKRKSVEGWSIMNIHFDILGGTFLLLEIIFTAINKNDIKLLFSNIAKLNLTLMTIVFDIILYIQYYKYRNKKTELLLENDT